MDFGGIAGSGGRASGPISQEDRTMAMLAHLLGIVTGFLGALIIWLVKKDTSPFVDDHGKEALNFQIAVLIVIVALGAFSVVTLGIGALLAVPLMGVVGVANLVFCILAGVAANNGQHYRYPVTIRLIR